MNTSAMPLEFLLYILITNKVSYHCSAYCAYPRIFICLESVNDLHRIMEIALIVRDEVSWTFW
ncbi:hypothetical protein Lmor_1088 [Legionella moravica]|uniref:Uncharacterized protein n=1 Tax=Legionella moravica TaxID=39962 RepID=A0A378K4I0_9GAMM|nr:hypothetical protein Lmor_1088 [Legionella moravica]STX62771.1 Uncharacterised protein [Legionella moravica]